jgi:hypothetical protein
MGTGTSTLSAIESLSSSLQEIERKDAVSTSSKDVYVDVDNAITTLVNQAIIC